MIVVELPLNSMKAWKGLGEEKYVRPNAVGVNARDLTTFTIDLRVAEGVVARVPADVPVVAESGIEGRGDVERMAAAGADFVLVGTSLARRSDPEAAVRALTGVGRKPRG